MLDATTQMLSAGDRFGAYVIRRQLGAGGMGEVYLAEHRNIDKRAAIKVLLAEHSANRDIVGRFLAEARAASSIKHPGIVEIIDCDADTDGRVYIVMELLTGESLGDSLQRVGSLDVGSALGIAGQIAGALSAAHSKGIIHRDLKPDNVFLAAPSGAGDDAPLIVKILDFGIAKLTAPGPDTHRTRTGNVIGTPLYMSPEQCRGSGAIDHRTDVYSLGCILFEMLAGRPPFVRPGAGDLIAAHITEPPPEIGSLRPTVSGDLARLMMGMLAKDPDARPGSMADVVLEIERILGVPAQQFSTLVLRPEGFSSDLPASEGPESLDPDVPPPLEPLAGGTRAMAANVTTFSETASERTSFLLPVPRAQGRRWSWGVASLVVLAMVAATAYVARTASNPPPVSESTRGPAVPSVSGAASQPPPPATDRTPTSPPTQVVVRIESRPAGAELWLEGEPTTHCRTPCMVTLPRDTDVHKAVLKLPGFKEKTLTVDSFVDAVIRIELDKLAAYRSRKKPKVPPYRRGHD